MKHDGTKTACSQVGRMYPTEGDVRSDWRETEEDNCDHVHDGEEEKIYGTWKEWSATRMSEGIDSGVVGDDGQCVGVEFTRPELGCPRDCGGGGVGRSGDVAEHSVLFGGCGKRVGLGRKTSFLVSERIARWGRPTTPPDLYIPAKPDLHYLRSPEQEREHDSRTLGRVRVTSARPEIGIGECAWTTTLEEANLGSLVGYQHAESKDANKTFVTLAEQKRPRATEEDKGGMASLTRRCRLDSAESGLYRNTPLVFENLHRRNIKGLEAR